MQFDVSVNVGVTEPKHIEKLSTVGIDGVGYTITFSGSGGPGQPLTIICKL